METRFHRDFKKYYKKLSSSQKRQTDARLRVFSKEPHHSMLHNHALKGRYFGYCSINITGDLRALYLLVEKDVALFVLVDTHSNLYK